MNLAPLLPFANHLWQSTLMAGVAGLLTVGLRKNRARVRHWVWVAASCKFLIPLSVLMALGNQIEWRRAPEIAPARSYVLIDRVGAPFTAPPIASTSVAMPSTENSLSEVLLGVWACGFLGIACAWAVRWRRIRAAVRAGSPVEVGLSIPAISSPALLEPGVFGMFRPVLLLPEGILDRLIPEQFKAVIAHELCHVRYLDNLAAAVHMFIETVFWFHPLLWWMGKRMVEERERACDEEVLRMGSQPRVYADAILNVCKHYVESPLACVSGVAGANLKKRIAAIMKNRGAIRLNLAKKVALAIIAVAAVAGPIIIGAINAPAISAQSTARTSAAPAEHFEVASVRPSAPVSPTERVYFGPARGGPGTSDPEHITWSYATLKGMLMKAYDVKDYQVIGAKWLETERYNIIAKVATGVTKEQVNRMWQSLIGERFGVAVHHEAKEFQVYELIVAIGGPKLKPSVEADADDEGPPKMDKENKLAGSGMVNLITSGSNGWTIHSMAKAQPIERLTVLLGHQLNRPVIDKTGLTGKYDFELEFAPEPGSFPSPPGSGGSSDPIERGPDLLAALHRQLGLTVVGSRADLDVLVIDKAEKVPTAN